MTDYRTTPDRIGWALAVGAACAGSVPVLLVWAVGRAEGMGLADLGFIWLDGTLGGAAVIAVFGAPIWWLVQRRGRRGPIAAGLTGAAVPGVMWLSIIPLAFVAGLPSSDAATLSDWLPTAVLALIPAFLGGLIALVMWLVAYRAVETASGPER